MTILQDSNVPSDKDEGAGASPADYQATTMLTTSISQAPGIYLTASGKTGSEKWRCCIGVRNLLLLDVGRVPAALPQSMRSPVPAGLGAAGFKAVTCIGKQQLPFQSSNHGSQ